MNECHETKVGVIGTHPPCGLFHLPLPLLFLSVPSQKLFTLFEDFFGHQALPAANHSRHSSIDADGLQFRMVARTEVFLCLTLCL